jgi:predicted nucleic acid-binding protein
VSSVVVVDASLAVKWLVREIHSDKAYALAHSWAREGVSPMVPYLMPVEVANALYKRVIRKEVSLQEATSLLDALLST